MKKKIDELSSPSCWWINEIDFAENRLFCPSITALLIELTDLKSDAWRVGSVL